MRADGSLALEESQVGARPGGPYFLRAQSIGPGRFRLDSLPATEVLLEVRGPYGFITQLHDGRVPFTRIVVGGPGSIRVTLTGVAAKDAVLWRAGLAAPGSKQDLTRARFRTLEGSAVVAEVTGLQPGTYEVWLERPSEESPEVWLRVGQATTAVIDAEHPKASFEWSPPD